MVTEQRCQTLHAIKPEDIIISSDETKITIFPSHLLKHSKPGTHLKQTVWHKYDEKPIICIEYYMGKSKPFRKS